MPHENNDRHTASRILATPFIVLVKMYRLTLSPDHGLCAIFYPYGVCRHEPTCSTYALTQLKRESLPIALLNIMRRVSTCHPWRQVSDERLRAVIEKRG